MLVDNLYDCGDSRDPFNQEGLMQNQIDQYEQAAFFRAHQQAS